MPQTSTHSTPAREKSGLEVGSSFLVKKKKSYLQLQEPRAENKGSSLISSPFATQTTSAFFSNQPEPGKKKILFSILLIV